MPLDDLRQITSQAFTDTQNVKKELEKNRWKIMTDDAAARRTQPTRAFQNEFETSVRSEWEVVKKELEEELVKSLLRAGSQKRLVSTQDHQSTML